MRWIERKQKANKALYPTAHCRQERAVTQLECGVPHTYFSCICIIFTALSTWFAEEA